MPIKIANLTVQKWGNSLAVRIPATLARSAHFHVGTPVELSLQECGIAVKPVGPYKITLAERLNSFNPKIHSGEVMDSALVGKEKF